MHCIESYFCWKIILLVKLKFDIYSCIVNKVLEKIEIMLTNTSPMSSTNNLHEKLGKIHFTRVKEQYEHLND